MADPKDDPLAPFLSFTGGRGVLADGPRLIEEAGSLRSGDMRYWGGCALSNRLRYGSAPIRSILRRLEKFRRAERDARFEAARGRALRLLGMESLAGEAFDRALRLEPRNAAALAFRGELRTVSDPSGSLADLEAALELEPENAAYALWRGYALFVLGKDREAAAALEGPSFPGPEGGAARLLRGVLGRGSGDLDRAEREFSAGLRGDPSCSGFFTLRAGVRWAAGGREGAVEDAHAALNLHPENFEGFIAILFAAHPPSGRGALRDRVVESAGRFLAENPGTAWALGVRGEFLGSGDTGCEGMKGFADLYSAAGADPQRAWILAYLARGLGQDPRIAGWGREAEIIMERAVAAAPGTPWLLAWRSQLHCRAGRHEAALGDLDAAIRLDRSNPVAYAWRGKVRAHLRDHAGADRDLSICIGVDTRPHFLHDRAAARWRSGLSRESLADLTECAGKRTSYALIYSGWPRAGATPEGFRFLRSLRREAFAGPPKPRFDPQGGWSGPVPVSAGALEKEIARRGSEPFLRLWLGRLRLDRGELKRALRDLRAAGEHTGARLLAALWQGELHCRAGDHASAERALDRAVGERGNFPPAHLWRGLARWRLGRGIDAARDFFRACRWASCEDASALRPAGAKGGPVYRWIRVHLPELWLPGSGPGPRPLLMAAAALVAGDEGRALGGLGRRVRARAAPLLAESRRWDRKLAALPEAGLSPRESAVRVERYWRAALASRGRAALAIGLDLKRALGRAGEREASCSLHKWCMALIKELRLYAQE